MSKRTVDIISSDRPSFLDFNSDSPTSNKEEESTWKFIYIVFIPCRIFFVNIILVYRFKIFNTDILLVS